MTEAIFTPAQLAEIHAYHAPHYVWSAVSEPLWLLSTLLILRFAVRPMFGLAERSASELQSRFIWLRWVPGVRVFMAALDRLWGEPGWGAALLFALFTFLVRVLLDLPSGVYLGYVHEHRFGLSTETPSHFAYDYLKGLLMGVAALSALAFGLIGLARRQRHWWLILGLVGAGALLFSAALDPYRARLFYRQKPLPAGELREQISALMSRAHLDFREVLVEETLGTSVRLQAYFAGVGPTRTIVLNDSLVKNLSTAEVLAVIAHEAGHVNESRWPGTIASSSALLLFLFAIDRLLKLVARRGWWGVTRFPDVRGLPLVFLVFALASAAVSPLSGKLSRARELEADRFALSLTQNPDAFEHMLVKAARVNKMDPDPPRWLVVKGHSHPPIRERLDAIEAGGWKKTDGG